MVDTFETFRPKYGYVMLMLDIPEWTQIQRLVRTEDLYFDPSGDRGYTKKPHVTALYGFLDHVVEMDAITSMISGMKPPVIVVKGISAFDTDPDFDVVKIDVDGEELRRMNSKLQLFPHKNLYDSYNPHITLAYVKKGCGVKYTGIPIPAGIPVTFVPTEAVYSSPNRGAKISIKLNG